MPTLIAYANSCISRIQNSNKIGISSIDVVGRLYQLFLHTNCSRLHPRMRSPSLMQLDALPAILSHKLEHVVSEDEISGIDAVGRLTTYDFI